MKIEDKMKSLEDKPDVKRNWKSTINRHRGVVFAFACSICECLTAILVSFLSGTIDQSELAFYRGFVCTMLGSIVITYRGTSIRPTSSIEMKWLAFQGPLTCIVVWSLYYSYQNMPAGDASALFSTYIAFSVLLGRLLLNERLGWLQIVFVILTIVGVVLIMRPSFIPFLSNDSDEKTKWLPSLCCLGSSATSSVLAVCTRSLGKLNTSPFKIMLYRSVVLLLVAVVVLTVTNRWWNLRQCLVARLAILGFSLSIFGVIVFQSASLMTETIAVVSVVSTSQICMIYIADIFVLGTEVNFISALGAVVVLFSSTSITIDKVRRTNNEEQDQANEDRVTNENSVCESDAYEKEEVTIESIF